MAKYTSGRQKNLKVGISSYSENLTSLEVIGGATFTGESSSELVRISQIGTGPALVVEDSANPDVTPFVVTTEGKVAIGVAAGGISTSYKLEVDGGDIRFVTGGEGDLIISHQDLVSSVRSAGNVQLGLGANGGDAIRVNLDNNVGFGTTNPTSKLYVAGDGYFTGVVTATTFSGNVTRASYADVSGISTSSGYANSAGIATYAGTSGIATYALTAGIATYATSAGIATYATNAGIATIATKLQTPRIFEIIGDIVASPITFDGTGNVSLAATIQPNSVALGNDTTGDYVQSVSGTVGQITITGGTGEGSTPVIAFSPNPTIGGNVTIGNDLQVNNNLNVTGNITVGGTTAYIIVQDFRVTDADITLGFTTDAYGNDASTDTTANHGGIAIASTEGSPLVQLVNVSIGESLPATYKKFMWFKSGSFAGLNTDAWLSNYAIGIGSTQFPVGTRLAVGAVQFNERDLSVVRNINSTGIITGTLANSLILNTSGVGLSGIATYNNSGSTTFTVTSNATSNNTPSTIVARDASGNFSAGTITANLTGTASTASFATTAYNLTDAANITSGTINTARLSGTYNISISGNAATATYATSAGIATNLKGGLIGNIPYQSAPDTTTFLTNGAFGTILQSNGIGSTPSWVPAAPSAAITGLTIRDEGTIVGGANSVSSLNFVGNIVSVTSTAGIATITFLDYISNAGLATYATSAGIATNATYATTAGIATYATTAGIATYAGTAGIATYATTAGIATYATSAGIATNATYATSAGIATYATSAGIATYATSAGIATYAGTAGIATALQNSRTFEITGDIIASPISFNGTGNVSLAATIQPNSVALGGDTTGNYVTSITNGSYITGADGGSEGATLTIGVAATSTNTVNQIVARDASGNFSAGTITANLTGTASTASFATTAYNLTDAANITSGTINSARLSGTYNISISGNAATATYATSAGIATNVMSGIASISQLSVSGISTLGTVQISSGIVTATSGIVTYYGDGSKLQGIISVSGISVQDEGSIVGTSVTTLNFSGSSVSVSNAVNGISTITVEATGISTYADNAGITTNIKGGLVGNILYQSAPDATTFLVNGSSGQILQSNGVGNIPSWVNAAPSSAITGLTVRDEGTIVGGANSVSQLNFVGNIVSVTSSAGIATITFLDYVSNSGLATYATSAGIATYAGTAGIATYATTSGVSTSVIGGISSITQLQVTGISTFSNGPVFIGAATSTGTASQPLQVTGGAYVSGLFGIGTTNPTTRISIGGTTGISFVDTNVRIGDVSTGSSITSGTHNNFIGASAGRSNTTGGYNNFFGRSAGYCNTTGNSNNFFGSFAGLCNTFGSFNNFFGLFAGYNNTTGTDNNFFGLYAGRYNTTGGSNNFFGCRAGGSNTTGCYNNFFGRYAGYCNTTGNNNNFFGPSAGCSNTTGNSNNFFGRYAGYYNSTGNSNNFFGSFAGRSNTTGCYNNFFGRYAGRNNTTGTDNIFFGRNAGCTNVTGSQNVVIGPTQNTPITSGNNQLVIGAGNTSWIVGNSSYNIGIGTTNPTSKLYVVGGGNFTGVITASQIDLTANATTDDSVLYLSGSVLGTQSKNGIIGIGQLGFSDTDIIANFAHNVNSYAQIVVQNKNSGNQASSDIVVNNDRTGGTTYYGDFGINGTTFSGGGPFGDPDGTYLYSSGGTLSVGTNDALDFRVATGSTSATPVTRLTVKGTSGNVGIGTTTPTEALQVQGNVSINGLVSYGTSVSTTTTVSQTTIHSGLSTSTYRSVEYTIQASQGTNYHVTKLLTVHDGTLAYNSEYGTIYTNGIVGTYDVDVSGGNIRLLVTPSSASTTNYTINFIATKI